MFDYLKKHEQIIITGPHRAGTTIATEMIAHDLNYECYLEERVTLFGSCQASINRNHRRNIKAVYQVPLLASQCHKFPEYVAIIFMIRNVDEIIASEKRINWGEPGVGNEVREMDKYCLHIESFKEEWRKLPIATIKYKVWNEIQKKNIKFAYELEYNSLEKHNLWVPKEKRLDFGTRQTTI